MKRKVGIIKRIFSLLLVFLFSINSFAAVVSDNDGSAFISKAEFDSLKNSFQSQIDSYNKSIDSKIDGAIASYLAGIRLSPEWNIVNKQAKFLNTWNYKEPQSYYQADVATHLVTYGINTYDAGTPSYDWTWPNDTKYAYWQGSNWYLYEYSSTNSTTTARPYGLKFTITKCQIPMAEFEAAIQSSTKQASSLDLSTTAKAQLFFQQFGLNNDQYEQISATWTNTSKTFPNWSTITVSGTGGTGGNAGSGPTYARALNENFRTLTPTAADSSSVQVSNESGKLFIDAKPYTELKIQNIVTLDCFHYQDKSSSATTQTAFADSSYNTTITVAEQWSWNTKYTSGTKQDVGTSTSTSTTPYVTVQNFLGFTKASSQVLKNTTWGRPSYTTNVVMVDDGLTLDKNGGSTQYYAALPSSGNSWTGTGKYLNGTTVSNYNVTLYYPKIQLPKYTLKQYTQQIYDYYSNDFKDKDGEALKWGEGVRIAECKAERDSSRIKINYHIENMSGTATTGSACNFELSTKKFVKCVAQSGTSMGTQTVTPSSSTTNTVTFDIGSTGENAELWLNAYCSSNNFTVVIDNIAAE